MRRVSLSILSVCVFLLLPAAGAVPAAVTFPQGIAAGDVTAQRAIVWTRVDGPVLLQVEYAATAGFAGGRTTPAFSPSPESDYTARVDLSGLESGRRYFYRFVTGSARSPSGMFVTPPGPESDAPVTLIWGADTSEENKPFRIFQGMRRRTADLFVYMGDTIYADFGTFHATALDQYRQKYRINREDGALREYLASVGSWVIWDGHEVENNFDAEHIRLETGRRAFLEYWPLRILPEAPGRLYRSFRWGRTAEVFILDARQYRTPAFRFDGPDKTMLGRVQKQWLLEGLGRSPALVKVIVSTVALRYHSADSWEGYAYERNEILRFIAERRIGNVLFLAGDVHYGALLRHAEGPYEAIAGPLAAIPARTSRVAGKPETLWSATGNFNYGWARIARDGITLEWRDDQDRLLHQAAIPIVR